MPMNLGVYTGQIAVERMPRIVGVREVRSMRASNLVIGRGHEIDRRIGCVGRIARYSTVAFFAPLLRPQP